MAAAGAFDAVILGAGAAGLFCAARAGQRGLRVLLIDHAARLAEKVRISGGGRANFTNRDLDPKAPQRHYLSANPRFCRSALARFAPADFIALLDRHGIGWHEKHRGQLFCDRSARQLIDMLLAECAAASAHGGAVERWQPCRVERVEFIAKSGSGAHPKSAASYIIHSERGVVQSPALVVASGGLSIPRIGASGLGLALARQFGLPIVPTRPGLVPLTFDAAAWAPYAPLAGLSLPVRMATGVKAQRIEFQEDLLFTHRGLSGPAVLQI
ncbi:MAG TPA: aminoacetone oxidase family FAD-binding enzyme, partial [Ottowia sp.]|nr:aminoacetone oxidase family FAD-binding enzyme [Ottowia sp.]